VSKSGGGTLEIWDGDGAIFISKVDNGSISPDLPAGGIVSSGSLQN